MLQSSDNSIKPTTSQRSEWMALLARAPLGMLEQALTDYVSDTPQWLRRPETGLMMIEGRTGGTGQRFNVGEVTVTRCALRLADAGADAPVGIAYVLGRSHQHAYLAAVADALLLCSEDSTLEHTLLAPVRQHLEQLQTNRQIQADSSKVEFFTVARETGQDNDSESSE
jgi:alpha-D-ribose 1-methylphosphonate 5-triphosphate synthase subunit PhnG